MTRREYEQWIARPQDFLDGEPIPGSQTYQQIQQESFDKQDRIQSEIDRSIRRAKSGYYED